MGGPCGRPLQRNRITNKKTFHETIRVTLFLCTFYTLFLL
jgi:hypothetical protein